MPRDSSLPAAACGLPFGIEYEEELHESVGVIFCPFSKLAAWYVEAQAAGIGFSTFQLLAAGGYRIDAVTVSVGFGEFFECRGIDTALHLNLQAYTKGGG